MAPLQRHCWLNDPSHFLVGLGSALRSILQAHMFMHDSVTVTCYLYSRGTYGSSDRWFRNAGLYVRHS